MVLELQLEIREREVEVQTIRGVLGGAGFLVVRHAEVGDDGAEVVDGVVRSRTATKAALCFLLLAAPPRLDRDRSVGWV